MLGSMLLAVLGYGQGVTTSSINGVVTDDKGQPLPGATIVAVHEPSGTRYGITTNAAGRYTFPAVRIGGPYNITVSFVGYQDEKRQLLSADLGVPVSLNIQLAEVGKQLSEVVVTARGSIIDSDRSGASTNFKKESFERLPTLNRSFQDFSVLTPQAGPGFSFGGRSNLYNNFSIDGATSNNVFGLSALPGGQSNAQPVSVDAIQEISVQLSPYDVSQGAFTGAGVNAVTRSGTNRLQGSAYYYTKNDALAGKKIAGTELPELQRPSFTYANYGARLGGAIIKNKLFFFGNFEREEATSPAVLYPYGQKTGTTVNQPGSVLANGNVNPETDLERLRTFLITPGNGKSWTYDPGSYNNFNVPQQSTKFLAKIDWNINDNNKLTIRYNQLNAFRDVNPSGSGGFASGPTGGRANSVNTLPFSNSYYRILNNLYSVFGELNSSFGNGKFANNLQLGYNSFRDTRQQGGGGAVTPFPTVDILGPNGQNLTSFGPDPFTVNNRLDQDVIQVNDKFDAFLGAHTFTLGTANEFYKFYNVFTQVVYGTYQYNSISDFINNATAPSAANAPTRFYQQYSALAGNPAPAADFKASQLGFYVQDNYTGVKNLRVTAGLRVDLPIYNEAASGLFRNAAVEAQTFANGEKLYVDKLPVTTPLYSPRIGFNWDVLGNKSLQVRGGAGVFTGRVPFVWISNQLSNNGVFFNTITSGPTTASNPVSLTTGQPNPLNNVNTPFNPDVNAYVPKTTSAASTYAINVTAPNFKFPQVFRTNIGIDKTLPGGFVATGELIYTKDINAVYIRDANLAAPVGTLAGDGRPLYGTNTLINTTGATQALVQDNTDKGYAFSLTGQIQKTSGRLNGSLAYTFTDSKDLNSQSGSTAGGLFTGNPYVTDINSPVLGYASNWFPHRVVGYVSYRLDYAKFFATTFSLIYEGRNGGNFSYTYGGAPNGYTGASNTNLLYVPRNQSEILLTTTNATDTRTTQQIWDQLNAYIEQDSYLKNRRGKYAERGAALTPWVDFLNLRVLQDFKVRTGNSNNSVQVSLEMFNLLNFLNSDWGVVKSAARTSLLGFSGYETPNTATGTTGRPIYTFATNADGSPLTSSYVNSQGVFNGVTTSRWQLQLGLRYIFN
ncbi:TonB-dependent receptor [Fibrella sp. HMF5335]|uniref:TonB-dependent receptor n=1 Tax=Fibrella rubiginis TaxID=2817060 RepID=A0A939GIN0_9BACT|nr:TonB-dependent receptor [Fibrella rubiginis]